MPSVTNDVGQKLVHYILNPVVFITGIWRSSSGAAHQVVASILARSSGVASGMNPNQALKAGRA